MGERNVRERHGNIDVVHLPNDYGVTAGFHTLCGLCDVPEWKIPTTPWTVGRASP